MNMGKKLAIGAAFAAMAVFAVAPAFAGVVSSNHDMIFKYGYTAAAAKAGACSFCHIPHKAGGDKLWAAATTTGTGWRSEVISNLCYSCHGTGTTYAGALELNPFGTSNKHGRTVANLTGSGDIASLAGVALLSGDGNLKCTSCHDVHSNDSRPFIKFVPAGTFAFEAHCKTCHVNRANTVGQETANVVNGFSQHPTGQVLGNTGDTDEGFQGTIAAQFTIVGGANGAGVGAWNLGGHRSDNTTTGNMTCATCHAVHGNETAVYTAADGATEVATENTNGFNNLAVLSTAPTTVSAAICTGCHTSAMPVGPGTLGFSHPVNTVSTTWQVSLPARPIVVGMKWGANSGDVIVCQSCHDMHYAAANTSLLRGTIDAPPATSNSNCNACHANSTMPNHHPAGIAYTGAASPVTHTTAYNWTGYAFGTAGPAYVFAAGNLMTCGTCHGAQAHNNAGSFPGLVGLNTTSEMCVDCHSTNPSQYTATANVTTQSATVAMGASHYVGPVVTAGYARTAAWQTTGLTSKYVGAQTHIICESCHTLKLSGTISGPTTSDNTVRGTAVRANVGLLLERNGNNRTVYNTSNTGTAADMCTGCHGGSPTGGTAAAGTATHPTISMGMTVAATAGIQAKVTANINSVSLTAGNLVNCESCHRPHDAAAGSGALILESVGTTSTKVAGGAATILFNRATGNSGAGYAEEATFCNFCHSY